MKSTDIALIVLIAVVSVVVSYFAGNAILGDPYDKVETMTYVKEVSADVVQPDEDLFNPYMKNPTQEVYVGRCEVGEVWNPTTSECVPFGTVEGGKLIPDPDPEPEPEPEPEED